MITHTAFLQHVTKIFNTAMLYKGEFRYTDALNTLEYAIQEIGIHTRNTVTKPPALLRVEREVFREAYELQKRKAA